MGSVNYGDTEHIGYCRTFNHSTMGVAPGSATLQHTDFLLPWSGETGPASLRVIANGIPSHSVPVHIYPHKLLSPAYYVGGIVLAGAAGGELVLYVPGIGIIRYPGPPPQSKFFVLAQEGFEKLRAGLAILAEAEKNVLEERLAGFRSQPAGNPTSLSQPRSHKRAFEQTSELARPPSVLGQPSLQSMEELGATLTIPARAQAELKAQVQLPSGKTISIAAEQVMVGRGATDTPEAAAIDLSAEREMATVSRIHAQITHVDDHFEIEDRHSANQTRLNQEFLVPRRRYRLSNGDVIEFGKVRCVFRLA